MKLWENNQYQNINAPLWNFLNRPLNGPLPSFYTPPLPPVWPWRSTFPAPTPLGFLAGLPLAWRPGLLSLPWKRTKEAASLLWWNNISPEHDIPKYGTFPFQFSSEHITLY